ncbi:MAG: nuclease [Armatimonadetes bacterium]|nr:nuclease [Armatimonadota bacterium]
MIFVPAIAYYEVRRELERLQNAAGIARLDAFCAVVPGRYVPLSDQALHLACRLWADARNAGAPTADPKELDCDVLIASQALTMDIPSSDIIIATTNIGHLARFVVAELWTRILP